jgi:hypothetical protein
MKQTAVEWLGNQIKTSKYFYKLMEDIQSRGTVAQSNILNQAKEMEKEQKGYSEEDLRDAFDSAREFNSLDGVVDVHIVLPMGGDMSDLEPLHFTFEEWFEQYKKK